MNVNIPPTPPTPPPTQWSRAQKPCLLRQTPTVDPTCCNYEQSQLQLCSTRFFGYPWSLVIPALLRLFDLSKKTGCGVVQVSVVIPMNLQLVILDFYPADPNDVQRLLTACAERKLDEVEEILQRRPARLARLMMIALGWISDNFQDLFQSSLDLWFSVEFLQFLGCFFYVSSVMFMVFMVGDPVGTTVVLL